MSGDCSFRASCSLVLLTAALFTPVAARAQFTSVNLAPAVSGYAYENSTLVCSPVGPAGSEFSYSYRWTVLPASTVPPDTLRTLTGRHFSKLNTVSCRIMAYNATGAKVADMQSAALTIKNTRPWINPPAVTPNPALTTSTLRCVPAQYGDADGDVLSVAYGWVINGVPNLQDTLQTLAPARFKAGDAIKCGAVVAEVVSSPMEPGNPIIGWSVVVTPAVPRIVVAATPESAGGTVTATSSSANTSCKTGECSVPAGLSTVTLTAVPEKGFRFTAWSRGVCANTSSQNPVVVTNAQVNTSCVAQFVAE